MIEVAYEAPAKVNLSLYLRAPDANGYHPLRSLVQVVEWVDELQVGRSDEDRLTVEGADLPDDDGNLVWKAADALGERRPQLEMVLTKRIAVAAGLGGGSSDAAAALMAVSEIRGLSPNAASAAAPRVGADVRLFLTGGTLEMTGYGERIERLDPLGDFALAIVVPPFELSTPEVYRRWDVMEGPIGSEFPTRSLPPSLRNVGPIRNDLTPAALAVKPELADWISDLSDAWSRPVAVSGSGPSLFGFFADLDEADDAASAASSTSRSALGVALRPKGVAKTA